MKSLIVYYSYEGNCEEIKNVIKEKVDADVLCLVPKKEKKTKSLYRFIWGGMQVYMTKKPELKSYEVDLDKYDNIFIGSPVWFGTYAPPVNTFILDNKEKIKNKNIALFICSGGNKRNTFENFEKELTGNNIIGKLELVYPIKNGIEKAKEKTEKWVCDCMKKI